MDDPPLKRIEVLWGDASVHTDPVSDIEADDYSDELTYSIGYLLSENKSGLVLVSDCYPGHKKEGRVPNFIPWGVIKDWWELEG